MQVGWVGGGKVAQRGRPERQKQIWLGEKFDSVHLIKATVKGVTSDRRVITDRSHLVKRCTNQASACVSRLKNSYQPGQCVCVKSH